MATAASGSVTFWLQRWREGAEGALEQLTRLVYEDLRRLAAGYLRDERADHTLQATALVHEVYLRISSVQDVDWKARGQFISVAAQMMRRILIDHARRRRAAKRDGGSAIPVAFEMPLARTCWTWIAQCTRCWPIFHGTLESWSCAFSAGWRHQKLPR
jgi:RNA polymerase sigma factor (TIGR02999 family)